VDVAADLRIRLAAIEWLRGQVDLHGDVLARTLLEQGFDFEGHRVPLLGPQGIFKPRVCLYPLSITTLPEGGPYSDVVEGSVLRYSYRGRDPRHPDDVGLRRAWQGHIPLILFARVKSGRYLAQQPVFVVGDDPGRLVFEVDLEVARLDGLDVPASRASEDLRSIERRYVVSAFRRRVHQRAFRERVLDAYREQCAICRLRHQELLDAAHIVGDSEEDGEPIVSNGLALCKLHHAAFDSFFPTVRPDYVIEVRPSILAESDGPMLLVGLKQMHGVSIQIPKARNDRPDPVRLERRYELFRRAS
jgi:putative restriction endonuclease